MRTAYYHEDDFCQREILPLTAKAFCLKEMGHIEDFVEDLREKNAGFTDIYVRNDSLHGMEELHLRSRQLEEALSFLPAYDRVETGYSTYREEPKSTYCRGKGSDQNVFWSEGEDGYINAIWLDIWVDSETKKLWSRILIALGRLAPVLLADWSGGRCVNLSSTQEIEQYVADEIWLS